MKPILNHTKFFHALLIVVSLAALFAITLYGWTRLISRGTAVAVANPVVNQCVVPAARVSAGTFGAEVGGGNYNFPGRVGIGTPSPTNRLSVVGTRGTTVSIPNAHAGIIGDDVGTYIGSLGASPWGSWIQTMSTAGAAFPLSLNPIGGNVGIGTTNPTARLHVRDGDIVLGRPQAIHGATHREFILHGAWNNLYIAPRNDANTAWLWDRFVINAGGNVGIGTTTPTQRLDVEGQIRIRGGNPGVGRVLTSAADGTASWQAPAAGGGLPIGSSGQTLRHDGTGWVANSVIFNNGTNVGIGMTNPQRRLHVAGEVAMQFGGATVVPHFANTGEDWFHGIAEVIGSAPTDTCNGDARYQWVGCGPSERRDCIDVWYAGHRVFVGDVWGRRAWHCRIGVVFRE